MNDRALVQKCLERDHEAWNEFIRRHYPLVRKCVKYKLKHMGIAYSSDLSEDITQDIFMMLWKSDRLSGVRNISSIKGWLAIVAINFTSSSMNNKTSRNDQITFSLDPLREENETSPLISSLGNDGFSGSYAPNAPNLYPQRNLEPETRDLREIVRKEIEKLVPKQALALKLNILDGLPQKDIAALLKIPDNTVATLIRRGKARLSKRVKVLLQKDN
jgi:RNA polymerase sigma factor (sigma-70 family)